MNLKELMKCNDITPDKKIEAMFNQHRPNHVTDAQREQFFTTYNKDLVDKIDKIRNQ